MFQCQVANIEPFGSVVTEDTSGFCTVPGYSGTPLPCYQPMSKPRQYYFKCCCIVPTGQSFHSPAPTTRLSCWTPPSEYSSSHLLDSWGALWWTSSATDSANRLRRPLFILTSMAHSPKLLHSQKPFSHHSMFHSDRGLYSSVLEEKPTV